jgi:DNA-binding transcriptional ArsR family regulator
MSELGDGHRAITVEVTPATPVTKKKRPKSAAKRRPRPVQGAAVGDSAHPAPDPQLFVDAAETFTMLASPTRLHLLWLLAQGGKDVGTLAEAVDGSVAMVSQHLAKLRLGDLVRAHRDGQRQVYVVDDPHVIALIEQALDHHAQLSR